MSEKDFQNIVIVIDNTIFIQLINFKINDVTEGLNTIRKLKDASLSINDI